MNLQKYPIWRLVAPSTPDPGLLESVGGDVLTACVLSRRGILSKADALSFLDPGKYQPASALELPGMDTLVTRLQEAIQKHEAICVWGDFDVDGQTSTTILVDTLRCLGAKVGFHIPVRATESHGVNLPGLRNEIDAGARIILTCDTGVGALDAVSYAAGRGVDMLISDHHELPETLPEARAVVNPHLLPAGHALSGLPGVGVAFQIALELAGRAGRPDIAWEQLDLAALGIVADVAEQRGDTRWLLQRGLECLRTSSRVGIKALCQNANLDQADLDEDSIGFAIAPRLNALGRLDDANRIVEFFTTDNVSVAETIARELESLNFRRRLMVEQVYQAARGQVEANPSLAEGPVLVLSQAEWPAGVVGIVASRLVELYGKPTVLLCTPPGEQGRGSARSIEGVHITKAIGACRDLLFGFGGHAMAAGLGIDPGNIAEFRTRLGRAVIEQTGGLLPQPVLELDAEIPLNQADLGLAERLDRLRPFGPGNPGLVFAAPAVNLESRSTFGKNGEHRELKVTGGDGKAYRAVWWFGAEMGAEIQPGTYDLAYRIHASRYQGAPRLQIEWVDARPNASEAIILPSELRKKLALVDLRDCPSPYRELQARQASSPDLVVWREGILEPAGVDRRRLARSPVLVIWTAPPGLAELDAAIAAVKPKEILVFGRLSSLDSPEAFLRHLLGMLKYGFQRKVCEFSLGDLAAASGHRSLTVRLGLEVLSQRGIITTGDLSRDSVVVAAGGDPCADGGADRRLAAILSETAAYRQIFRILPLNSLINQP